MTQHELKSALLANKKPLLLIGALAVVVVLVLGGSFVSLAHNKMEMRKLIRQSAQLDKEHETLREQLKHLEKQDPAYIEKIARTQYNMVKPGEIEFRFQPE